jgi:hypothetical protein
MSSAFNYEAGDRTLPNQTVPVHAEEISVSRRQVAGDRVQVSTIPREEERLVDGTATPGSTTVDTTTFLSGGSHTHRRISWAAIFGGVILVVAVQLLLSLLGAGIGLGTVDTNAGSTPTASSLGVTTGAAAQPHSCHDTPE